MRKVLLIFGQLSDADVDWLTQNGKRTVFPAGATLIQQGTEVESVFVVLDGQLAVTAGRGVKIAQVGAGDILGEMSLVDSGLSAATVTVERDATVLSVSKARLREQLARDVGFAARFYRALAMFLAERMRRSIRRMGFGDEALTSDDEADLDALDPEVLDTVHLAGARFERMLKRLAG
jgi:CRP/FNR family transcriptional regulator, cyclic AMP receptor protein